MLTLCILVAKLLRLFVVSEKLFDHSLNVNNVVEIGRGSMNIQEGKLPAGFYDQI